MNYFRMVSCAIRVETRTNCYLSDYTGDYCSAIRSKYATVVIYKGVSTISLLFLNCSLPEVQRQFSNRPVRFSGWWWTSWSGFAALQPV